MLEKCFCFVALRFSFIIKYRAMNEGGFGYEAALYDDFIES